jgi:hypothetical protein
MLARLPLFRPEDLTLPPLKRVLKLGNARQFYIPVQRAINLALDFDDMIRWGLQERNPHSPAYVRETHMGYTEFNVDAYDPSGTTPVGIVVMGFGGTGKSQTTNRILLHYPQAIIHSEYRGRNLTLVQVVWLKLDCPEGGTRKELLIAIFQALDEVAGTDYFAKCANYGKATVAVMMPRAANVLRAHLVGALVIDEFQNFYGSHEGVLTIRFLRRLNNELGIPLVFIGTPDAQQTMIGQFSLTRRGSAYGNHEWRTMKRGIQKDGSLGDWDVFFAAVSIYRYVDGAFDDDGVSEALHDVSGGIPDLAIKIWYVTQNRLLRAGKMAPLTAAAIRNTARTEFPWIADAVAALKEGTNSAYRRYSDLYFRHVKEENAKQAPGTSTVPASEAASLTEGDVPAEAVPPQASEHKRRIPRRVPPESDSLQPVLLKLVDAGKTQQKSAYQSLLDARYITDIARFLD